MEKQLTKAEEQLMQVLWDLEEASVKEIIEQGGYVDKFIGDAILAVFRDEYHLDRAIDAALAVRTKIAALPSASELFSPKVSIGINSGALRLAIKGVIIILMMAKAFYIVAYFMHVKHETKSFAWTLALPTFILIPYLLFVLLSDKFEEHLE